MGKKSLPRVSIPVGSLASRTPGRPAYQYRPVTARSPDLLARSSSCSPTPTAYPTPQSNASVLGREKDRPAASPSSAQPSSELLDNSASASQNLDLGSDVSFGTHTRDEEHTPSDTPRIGRFRPLEASSIQPAETPKLRARNATTYAPILDDSLPAREEFWSRRALEDWGDDLPILHDDEVKAIEDRQAMPGINLQLAANYRLVEKYLSGVGPPLHDAAAYEKKQVLLDQLPIVFDSLNNDYNLQYQTVSKLVTVRFLGPPGLKPYDVRGRFAKFAVDSYALEEGPDKCVWRSVYTCSGSCERVDPAYHLHVNPSGKTDNFLQLLDHPQERDDTPEEVIPTRKHAPCPFNLFLEMTPSSIEKGVAFLILGMPEFHAEPQNKELLRISLAARNFLHTSATSLGTSMSKMKKLWKISERNGSAHRTMLAANGPLAHRGPTEKDFETALETAMRRERLDEMPLAAIEVLNQRHPESFLFCEYPSLLYDMRSPRFDKNSRFMCIIAPPHGLHNALRFAAENGLNVDSSWRNKNANRSPVTIVSTSNEYGHLVPVAVMVSSHADTETYTMFLRKVRQAIQDEAQRILDEPDRSTLPAKHSADLLSYAEDVVVAEEFCPAFVTIDCDDAERNAIREVWGNVTIILCQFHFMQAARLKGGHLFGRNERGRLQTVCFLRALRKCQRCPDESQWPDVYEEFRQSIRALLRPDQSIETIWSKIDTWLMNWWFSDRWRECLVDYGLPPNVTRGGPFTTNNLVEGAFRVFDRVYLDGVANKRLDRLVVIIVVDFFPSFQSYPPEKQRSDPQVC